MKHLTTAILFAAGLALAGCSSTGTAGATSTSGTTGGVDAANADVKGSTSATGATPANTPERR